MVSPSRVRLVGRAVAFVMLVLGVLMFVPSMRTQLMFNSLPLLWRDIPTLQLLKVKMNTRQSSVSALAACTQPASAFPNNSRLQKLLDSEPFGKVLTRPQDKAALSRAWTWLNQSAERRQRYSRFLPVLTPVQKAQLLLTWRVFHEALALHNVSYYLIAGTLVGALRHEGLIPWDDDMDIVVDEKDLNKVHTVLSCVPGYTLHFQPNMHWKFFANDARVISSDARARIARPRQLEESEKKGYAPEWYPEGEVMRKSPFLDIFVTTRDDEYIWCINRWNTKNCIFRIKDVYPLTEANFEGLKAPVPGHSAAIVSRNFHVNMCESPKSDHFAGSEIEDVVIVPCQELAQMHTVHFIE